MSYRTVLFIEEIHVDHAQLSHSFFLFYWLCYLATTIKLDDTYYAVQDLGFFFRQSFYCLKLAV